MKKIIAIILCLVMCFSMMIGMTGCGNNDKTDSNSNANSNGNNSINSDDTAEKVKVWLVTEEIKHGATTYKWEYEYDESGKLIKICETMDDSEEVYGLEYDDKGHLAKFIGYPEGAEPIIALIECDEKGNIVKLYPEGQSDSFVTAKYDEHGNPIEVYEHYAADDIMTTTYKFDDYGNCCEYTYVYSDRDPVTYENKYTYDDNGRIQLLESGHISYRDYNYDDNGNLLSYKASDGRFVEFTFKYSEFEVPADQAERLKKQVDNLLALM